MTRRTLAATFLCLSCLGFLGAATAAAATSDPSPPPKCFRADANGDLPTCSYDGSHWTVSYSGGDGFDNPGGGGGGGIPSGLIALFVIAVLVGIGVTVWRVSTARSLATNAGLNPNTATAVTLLGNDGLDAAYLASSLRDRTSPPPTTSPSSEPARTTAERLTELQSLRDQGLVTAEEYDARRKAIIDNV